MLFNNFHIVMFYFIIKCVYLLSLNLSFELRGTSYTYHPSVLDQTDREGNRAI